MKVGKLYKIKDWKGDLGIKGTAGRISLRGSPLGLFGRVKLFTGDIVLYLGKDIYGTPNEELVGPLLYVLTSSGDVGAYSQGSSLGQLPEKYFEEAKRTS